MTKNPTILKRSAVAVALLGTTAFAHGEEVTLSAVSAFAEGTTFSSNFERFIERLNEIGKGVIQIDYKGGGGKVMDPFQLGDAVRTGVVDIANMPGAFYTKLMPEADAFKLSAFTITEERANGAWKYTNDLHKKRINAWHLARQKDCVPFHLYLNKRIESRDLTGLNIRVTPIYRAFFASMGAAMIRTSPGDVYTALERGTVDGYGWPSQGVLDLGWHEVTKFRVDPPFYRASVEVLVNLDTWNGLTDEQRATLQQAAGFMEALCDEDRMINEQEIARQTEVGIEAITFKGDEAEAWLNQAYEAGWDEFIKTNPEEGPRLRELLSE